ncbi:hypothetical protein A2U01_0001210 [Trifolium medium]|uniref:Uncharacterized protein n=1 Tax=Trifolium medium TaxID=97028 RepID=A0A392LZI3_9FABA|nr:hypothetical protein [Trifolium medium]
MSRSMSPHLRLPILQGYICVYASVSDVLILTNAVTSHSAPKTAILFTLLVVVNYSITLLLHKSEMSSSILRRLNYSSINRYSYVAPSFIVVSTLIFPPDKRCKLYFPFSIYHKVPKDVLLYPISLGSFPVETSPDNGISLLLEYSNCLYASLSTGHVTSHVHLRATYYSSNIQLQGSSFKLPSNFAFPPRSSSLISLVHFGSQP